MEKLRRGLGHGMLTISILTTIALPVVPFLGMSVEQTAYWASGLFFATSVTWWLSIVLLGKEIVEWSRRITLSAFRSAKAVWRRIRATKAIDQDDRV